jgi:hypothetical protein
MNQIELTPDDLLMGSAVSFEVVIPPHLLHRSDPRVSTTPEEAAAFVVRLRPLTIGTFQLIMKAARNDPGLIPLLMIKESLEQPNLSLDQVRGMHLGLVNFLITQIREISGLVEKKNDES